MNLSSASCPEGALPDRTLTSSPPLLLASAGVLGAELAVVVAVSPAVGAVDEEGVSAVSANKDVVFGAAKLLVSEVSR